MLNIGYAIAIILAIAFGVLHARAHEAHEPHATWYKSQRMNPETKKRLGVAYQSCCDIGDHYPTRFKLVNDGSKYGSETYEYWDKEQKKWRVVPADIIQRKKTPEGKPVLFRSPTSGQEYCFIIDEEGI